MKQALLTRSARPDRSAARRSPALRASPIADVRRGGSSALFVTTEIADFVKTGGLGDVAAALPRALSRWHDVRVLVPGYPSVLENIRGLRWEGWTRPVAGLPAARIGRGCTEDGLGIYVVRETSLFERVGSPYLSPSGEDWGDNAVRFALLSMAAAQIGAGSAGLGWRPDLLHLNDWPTALAPSYLRWHGYATPCLLTIHNLAHQGLFPLELKESLGIPSWAGDADYHGQLSFLRAGLLQADMLTTVSGHYAQQITQASQGMGMHAMLHRRASQGRLVGIVNGIDDSWNIERDPALPLAPDRDPDSIRRLARLALCAEMGLEPHKGPLFAFVARMVAQKGIDLVCEVGAQIVRAGGQLALIGCGDADMEAAVRRLARRFPGRIAAHIGFTEAVARRMFAGSDFLLMPSRFEPCGLSQMYAQAYGSLPIAHATGGLVDTIEDGVTGLLFADSCASELRKALARAFRIHDEPELMSAMRHAAMALKHGWEHSARKYSALYGRAMAQPAAA